MVKVTIGGQSKDFQFGVPKADYGHVPQNEEYPSAIAGKSIWLPMLIRGSDLSNLNSLTIIAQYGENRENEFKKYTRADGSDDWRERSRVGIWTAVKDSFKQIISVNDYARAQNNNAFPHGTVKNCNVRIDKWDFGNQAMIMIDVSDSEFDNNEKLTLSLCAMPYFLVRDGPDAICTLRIQLQGNMTGGTNKVLGEHLVKFHRNDDIIIDSTQTDIIHLVELGALNKYGEGNSIHPKQLLTSATLVSEVQGITHKQHVDIAYIGTDTTENFSSLIRTIKTHISDRIGTFHVYYTEAWDEEILETYPNLLQAAKDISGGEFELKFEKIPSKRCEKCSGSDFIKKDDDWVCEDCNSRDYTLPLPNNIESADFTVATYVTPWAINTETEDQYIRMLNHLMSNDDSKLISVDPKAGNKSVRTWCSKFNLSDIYKKKLQLKSTPISRPQNQTVDAIVWRKKKVID